MNYQVYNHRTSMSHVCSRFRYFKVNKNINQLLSLIYGLIYMYIQCSCVHITKKILCNSSLLSTTVSQFNSVNFRTSAIVEPLIIGYVDTTKILIESK